MRIQNISLFPKQPNFNSRSRVNQQKTLVCHPKNAMENLHLLGSQYPINYSTNQGEINKTNKTYDSFTGLRDKKYLLAVLEKRIASCKKNNKSLSIAMFDMDNFKSVNELLGYETGDKFIKTIGQNISNEAHRNSIHSYRFGGDEFVLVFNGQTPEEQKKIADIITEKINKDEYIKSQEQKYHSNALDKLLEYGTSSKKINDLMALKSKKAILSDIKENLATEEAKNDSYLVQTIDTVNADIKSIYTDLIKESEAEEKDEKTKSWLSDIGNRIDSPYPPSAQEEKELDEYLLSIYDKSPQIYQIKKWISDFQLNNGFSVSGGVVTFTPATLQDKTPLDLINDAGEVLKKGKNTKKGVNYTQIA